MCQVWRKFVATVAEIAEVLALRRHVALLRTDQSAVRVSQPASMLGDIFTCLLVSFRLFFVFVLLANVVAWLLLGDDDDEDAAHQVQSDPGGRACCSHQCALVGSRGGTSGGRGRRSRDRKRDESASVSGMATLPLADDVGRLEGGNCDDEEDEQSADAESTAADDELSETDSVDDGRKDARQEPKTNSTELVEFDASDEQRLMPDGRNAETHVADAEDVSSANTGRKRRRNNDDDEWISSEYDDERAAMAESAAAPQMIQSGPPVAALAATAVYGADSAEAPTPNPRTSKTISTRLQQPTARRPASHW